MITVNEPFIEILAAGAFTEVDLGEVTAVDDIDVIIIPTTASSGEFPIGLHEVVWTATDSAGNTVTSTQLVNVISSYVSAVTSSVIALQLYWSATSWFPGSDPCTQRQKFDFFRK